MATLSMKQSERLPFIEGVQRAVDTMGITNSVPIYRRMWLFMSFTQVWMLSQAVIQNDTEKVSGGCVYEVMISRKKKSSRM